MGRPSEVLIVNGKKGVPNEHDNNRSTRFIKQPQCSNLGERAFWELKNVPISFLLIALMFHVHVKSIQTRIR